MLLNDLAAVQAAALKLAARGMEAADHHGHERDIEDWILATIDRMGATSAGPYSAYLWAYDHRGGRLVSCMVRGSSGEPLTISFRFGQEDSDDFEMIGLPLVRSAREAEGLFRQLASRLNASLTLCRGV